MLVFFFFKHNTAYEMRISDWSSDVCSSDLAPDTPLLARADRLAGAGEGVAVLHLDNRQDAAAARDQVDLAERAAESLGHHAVALRSEERRVGQECVSTCRSWWSQDH